MIWRRLSSGSICVVGDDRRERAGVRNDARSGSCVDETQALHPLTIRMNHTTAPMKPMITDVEVMACLAE